MIRYLYFNTFRAPGCEKLMKAAQGGEKVLFCPVLLVNGLVL